MSAHDQDTFGGKLRTLRKDRSLTQRELASIVGMDFAELSKIEAGRLPPPEEDMVAALCIALECAFRELLSLARQPFKPAEEPPGRVITVELPNSLEAWERKRREWDEMVEDID